jgi:hypothetical protein
MNLSELRKQYQFIFTVPKTVKTKTKLRTQKDKYIEYKLASNQELKIENVIEEFHPLLLFSDLNNQMTKM